MNHHHQGKTPPAAPPPGAGIDLWGHHISPNEEYAVLAVLIAVAAYCLVLPRVRHALRRLGISLAGGAAASAVFIGWHDHAHHARVAQAAIQGHMQVPKELLYAWAAMTAITGVAAFAASTWFLAQVARGRYATLARWLRLRPAPRPAAAFAGPAARPAAPYAAGPPPLYGRPPGRPPGGPPYAGGYQDDPPYMGGGFR
jgi:hypothetical protein